ncbi:MAG: transglutaminase-like domain-containing protein [Euryarchaeota archaeon]|nr:transglutaminase-like domain-containing protein [Euryarchaeota archaeon]
MKKEINKKDPKKQYFVRSGHSVFNLGAIFILLLLSASSGYLFLENQEISGQLNQLIDQKSILDAEVPDPIIKYAPLLVSSKDPVIIELAASLGGPEEIYRFVKDDIDYSEAYDERRIATEVLNTRQGDCLGKSNLLAGLLLAYGHSSKEVMVNMGYVTVNGVRRHHAWVEVDTNGKWIVLDSSQFLGNFEFNRWDTESFYKAYQAQPYAEFNDKFVQVNLEGKV